MKKQVIKKKTIKKKIIKKKTIKKKAIKKPALRKSHSRECEIMAFGVCTCDWWELQGKKEDLGITESSEKLATVLAICREHTDGFDMLKYIEKIILGKEQYVPPSQR